MINSINAQRVIRNRRRLNPVESRTLPAGWPNAYCEGEGDARICWESKEIKEQAEREKEEERKWREENEGQLLALSKKGTIRFTHYSDSSQRPKPKS